MFLHFLGNFSKIRGKNNILEDEKILLEYFPKIGRKNIKFEDEKILL